MTLINTNFPGSRIREWNGRYIYKAHESGATATIPQTATPAELAEVGLYTRVADIATYDPTTEKLSDWSEPVLDAVAGTATYSRVAIPLTQEELDSKAAAEADSAEAQLLRTAYQTFKSGTATNAQAQRAIAWLIKQTAGL